jgi:glycerol-3-phosphate dehydrogenase (NAD(P)+)
MAIVTIVGAGLMGSATAWPLADNGHEVRLVGTHLDSAIIQSCQTQRFHPTLRRELPHGVQAYSSDDIGEALHDAEIIVSGVSSPGVRWVGETIGPHLRPGQIMIAVTKGLEADSEGNLAILPDVLRGMLPGAIRDRVPLAAIGGPCIAGELAGRRPSCVVFGSRDAAALETLARAFRTPSYQVWTTTDLVGLEYCAALKNAYALGVGLALGLLEQAGQADASGAHMHNLAAALFAEACTEIERMLEVVGATRRFAYGLPGAGDLYVTSAGGRTIRCGALLGKGHPMSEVKEMMAGLTLEGVEIVRVMSQGLPKLIAEGRLRPEELPMLKALVDVVVRERPVQIAAEHFFGGTGRV